MKVRLAISLVVLAACGKSAEQQQAEAAIKALAEAGKQLGEAAAGTAAGAAGAALGSVKASEPVDFRALKDLLPAELPGMRRTSFEGEKAGAMGFIASHGEARYEAEDGSNVTMKITDMGAMVGMAAMAAYGWALATVDRETETGYERTTTIKGYKGFEKFDRENKSGELSLLVGGRFIVEINGYGVPIEGLKGALDQVDLGKLDGMKTFGVP